jgi:hypothetical protein
VLGPPKLALLCVRELHRLGHGCAAGEADPSEVAAKLMLMAAAEAQDSGDADSDDGEAL